MNYILVMKKFSFLLLTFLLSALTISAFSQETFKKEWVKGYGGSNTDAYVRILYDKNGDYYLTGYFGKDSIYFGNGIGVNFTTLKNKNVFIKFNKYHLCQWVKTILKPEQTDITFAVDKLMFDNDSNILALGRLWTDKYQKNIKVDFGNGVILDLKGSSDFVVVKYDRNGNIISGFSHGSEAYEFVPGMALDKDGNIYLSGYSGLSTNVTGSGTIDFGNGVELTIDTSAMGHFSKYTKDGVCLWAKKLAHPNSFNLARTSAGYIYYLPNGTLFLSGYFNVETDFGDGKYIKPKNDSSLGGDFFIANYTTDGKLNWVKIWDKPYMARTQHSFLITKDNGFYISGAYDNDSTFQDGFKLKPPSASDLYLAKCDSLSRVEWVKSYNGDGVEDAAIFADESGNMFLYGQTKSTELDFGNNFVVKTDTGFISYYLAGIDKNGNVESLNVIDGIVDDYWNGISVVYGLTGDMSINLIMCGAYKGIIKSNDNVYPSSGSSDAFLASFGIECIQFDDFNSIAELSLIESAEQIDSFVRLTKSAPNEKGAIWYDTPLPVWKGFSTEFTFRMSKPYNSFDDGSLPGADGIAFVIQNSSPDTIGISGGGLGFEGIPNSLAIEFDTYRNQGEPYNEIDGNHVAVFCNGINPNNSNHSALANLGTTNSIIPIRADSTIYHAKIVYIQNTSSFEIYLDTTGAFLKPVLVVDSLDLTKIFGLRNGVNAYVGITSATGTSYENQDILGWSLCMNTTVLPTGVKDKNYENVHYNTISISPNPASDYIEISYPPLERGTGGVSIRIFDILGFEEQKGMDYRFRGNDSNYPEGEGVRIDISGLSPGLYFVRVGNKVQKFIKY